MRAVCDVCEAAPARMFCAADQAAMCMACDEQIHKCNKLAMTHVRVELGESAPTPQCEECHENPAFFFTPEDGMSLCLQCDLVVHPTSGPGWERFMIYEQRVRLPKSAVDGKCGGCAGKCKQCRKAWDEAQSLPAQHRPASPCVTPERRAKHGSAVEWARPSPHYSGMDVLDGQNSSGNHSPTSSDLSCNIRPRRSAGKTKTKSTTATDIDPAEARSARGGGGECGKRALGDVESKPLALNKMARVSPREAAGGFSQSEAEPAVITRVDLVGCE